MQYDDAEAELSALALALRAHLEWAETLGTLATPPIDEEWLQARRAQYRALPVDDDAPAGLDTPQVAQSSAAEGSVPVVTARVPVAHPTIPAAGSAIPAADRWVPTDAGQIPVAAVQVPVGGAVASGDTPLAAELSHANPTVPPLRASGVEPTTDGTRARPAPRPAAAASPTAAPYPTAPPPAVRAQSPVQPAREPGVPLVLSADARSRLTLLEQEVKSCTRCRLHETRTQTVFSRGEGTSGLCFVGEGPGADEDLQGYPFVGAAGQLLDRMIAAMGLGRDEVYVCNIVKCRPPQNRKPQPDESDACFAYLDEQLQLMSPKVIVALGATAASGLLGIPLSITRLRGNWRLYRGRVPVMPTFHPSYLLRTPAAKREVWSDLLLVLDQLGLPRPKKAGA